MSNDPNMAMLNTAFRRAGFVEPLSSPGSYTVFAPTDAAFNLVPAVYMELFFENDSFLPHLRRLLLHQILPGTRLAADFVDGITVMALSGENYPVLQNPLSANGIPIVVADNEVSNGVVHTIDDILTPSWVLTSLQGRITEDAELSVLFSLMNIVGFNVNIEDFGEYTLLAPTNDAFLALGDENMAFLTNTANVQLVGQFLNYHLVRGVYVLPELRPSRLDTFEGGVVSVSVNPTRFNGVTVAEGDILAKNGVLHKINSVLFFQNGVRGNTALDFVADNPELSILFGALQRSGFDRALSQPASLTIFAPTNAAFNQLPNSLLSTLFFNNEFVPHLRDLLLYHIIGGEIFSNGFVNGTVKNTLNEEAVGIRTDPLAVNGNLMLALNNDVSNGVVHTLGAVLAPSWVFNTLNDLVVFSSSLSTLLNLMVLAGLNLSGSGAFTLLAPINTAFTAMQEQDLQGLINNVELRYNFLAKHVVQGVFTTFMLAADQELPNILGTGVTVTSINPILLDGVASVVFSNALASNGVFHAIDTVLDSAAR
jgi:transforming growth factor-beta-induced protein